MMNLQFRRGAPAASSHQPHPLAKIATGLKPRPAPAKTCRDFPAGGFVLRTVAHGEKPPNWATQCPYPPSCTVECVDICQGICHKITMSERHVKLFKNGRNQAVRIPREFELPGEDAIIRKEGQRLIIEAAPPRSLLAVLATLQTLDENFPPIEDPPAEPVDL